MIDDFDSFAEHLVDQAGARVHTERFVDIALGDPDVFDILEEWVGDPSLTIAEALVSERVEQRARWMQVEEAVLVYEAVDAWVAHVQKAKGAYGPGRTILAVDAVSDPPPRKRSELKAWVLRHGVRECLSHPLRLASPLAPRQRDRYAMMVSYSIGDVVDGRAGNIGDCVEDAAFGYLAWAAGRRALGTKRAELWNAPARSDSVASAAARVHALIDALADAPPAVVAAKRIRMGPTEDALGWAARTDRGACWLSFVERSPQAVRAASILDERHFRDHEILRLTAEHALDALLDAGHPEHDLICEAVEQPRWTFLLQDLEKRLEHTGSKSAFEANERLTWRVEVDPEAHLYGQPSPAVQKRGKRGWSKGRQVKLSFLESRPGPLPPHDQRTLSALNPGSYLRADHGAALAALVGHPHVVRRDAPNVGLQVLSGEVHVVLDEATARPGTRLRFRLVGGRGHAPILSPDALLGYGVAPELSYVALHKASGEGSEQVVVAPLLGAVRELALATRRWQTAIPPEADEALLALMGRLPEGVTVELPARLRGEPVPGEGRPVVRLHPRTGGALSVQIRVRPLASGPAHRPGHGPPHQVGVEAGRRVHVKRDLDGERSRARHVEAQLGLSNQTLPSCVPDGPSAYRVDDPEDALDVVRGLTENPDLAIAEWPDDAWSIVGFASERDLRVAAKERSAWFEIGGDVLVDETRVSLLEMVRALRDGRRYVELGKGEFVALEAQLRASLAKVSDLLVDDGARLLAAPEAAAVLDETLPELKADDAFQKRLELIERARQAALGDGLGADVEGLEAELRGYQVDGVSWLRGLASWSSGACLADDMGLGKTLQSIALLLDRASHGPALVVAPTSVADNWRREMERFAPSLSPRVYRGSQRAKFLEGLGPGDVLVTSYGLLTRDVDVLSEHRFGTLVLDEAHALKNARAQRTKAARRIDAGFTLGLTGTPIENHLGELFSLFDVLVPGLLGTWPHFRARFALPIERHGDLKRRDALGQVIRPFLLRRQKQDVAPELPPRLEVVRRVELSADERARYETERRRAQHALEEGGEAEGTSRIQILAALTRMRRLVCHPALVDDTYAGSSAKLDAVLSLARDLVREGHRTLLFSQFTGHLGLVRRGLSELGFAPLYLDGSTPAARRSTLVDTFQRGESPFFLISLKAGGTGLNLTAADTVIHLDPWWNPASEDQASDRAHRIGQDRPVTVIRMVAEQTLEEAVLALHDKKRELARGVLEGSDTPAPLDVQALLGLLGS